MNEEIEVEYFDDEVRIVLPARDSDGLRGFGSCITIAGLGVIFGCLMLMGPRTAGVGIAPGLIVVYIGLCLVLNKTSCCIRWTDDKLESIEYFGWFWFTRRCDAKYVSKFVHTSNLNHFTEGIEWLIPKRLRNLSLELSNRDELFSIVYWYPRDILNQVTDELSHTLATEYRSKDVEVPPLAVAGNNDAGVKLADHAPKSAQSNSPIEVVELKHPDAIIKKPIGSRVKKAIHDQAIVFTIPPKGFWKGSGDVAKTCAVVIFVVGYATAILFVGLFQGNFQLNSWLFLILLWAGAYKFWEYCFAKGRSSATIGASAESIWIDQTVGVAENEINEFGVLEIERISSSLLFKMFDGSRFQISITLSEQEQRWIANELTQYVGLGEIEPNRNLDAS
jgi:hypothetical protein